MSTSASDTLFAPRALRTEYLANPLGLHESRPRLFWQVHDSARGARQSAWQVLVASSRQNLDWDRGDLWDSGKVASSRNTHIEYDGAALVSRQRCWWKVRTWDGRDQPSPWSLPAFWEMGLLTPADWQGQWIGADLGTKTFRLRRAFATGQVRRARLYATARGLYLARLNGKPVGDALFGPGWTDYRRRLQVQAFDVTDLLRPGDNVLAATLGPGWFCGHVAWRHEFYGKQPSFLAQLVIELEDGSQQVVASDGAWKAAKGPIIESDMLMGETYDARLETPGWDAPGFDESAWAAVRSEPLAQPLPVLVGVSGPPVRRIEEIKPVGVRRLAGGGWVFDLGQNMVGWCRLKVAAPAGTTLTLRHAEVLNPDGTLYTANLRKARCVDRYTAAGGGVEGWEPSFTFHGFRYVELTASGDLPVTADMLTGVVLHSDMPVTGSFECSFGLLNQLQHNIQWGQKGNFLDIPTDCPQRDERMAWTGDIQVFSRTACFNMDVSAFMTKWIVDLMDAQGPRGSFPSRAPDMLATPEKESSDGGPAWAEAAAVVPWNVYLCYGDRRMLERVFPHLVRYLAYLATCDPRTRHNYADWLHHDAHTPPDLIHFAFWAHAADLTARMATVLGRKRDAARFRAVFAKVKRQFQRRFVTAEGRVLGDTQTAYVLALRFDLLPEKLRAAALEHLAFDIERGRYSNTWRTRNGHVSCGFVGIKHLPFVLSDAGRLDLAYRLLLNEDYPSWLFPVKNGATTIWERWDGWTPDKGFQDPGMNSFNHYAYGAIGEWMYRVMAGLDIAEDGAGHTRLHLHPRPPAPGSAAAAKITRAAATYESLHGPCASTWRIDGGRFELRVLVPANVTATVRFAAGSLESVTEGGRPVSEAPGVSGARMEGGDFVCQVGAGDYRFTAAWPAP